MLSTLSIRDVVLIEKLDLTFGPGLTVLTGETGAGKSILLDALGLAMGARADAGLIRAGCEQAVVAAGFQVKLAHPANQLLAEQGLDAGPDILLRRILGRDGRSRALVNDQPVGLALLRKIAGQLIEIQGQNEQIGLADPANHLALIDAFGVKPGAREALGQAWRQWREALAKLEQAEANIADAAREEDFLRHTVAELTKLAPEAGEETALAAERLRLQAGEKRAEAVAAALADIAPRERRNAGPAASLRSAARALSRIAPQAGASGDEHPAAAAMAAIERAEEALSEAEMLLHRLAQEIDAEPRALEATEERLFALRAAARKHGVAVVELPDFLTSLRIRLNQLETGAADIVALSAETARRRDAYIAAAEAISATRADASARLIKQVARELPPLKLDRAKFTVEIKRLEEAGWGPRGMDYLRFLIATNPGDAPGALDKIASGGELSRLMLALKLVLTGGSDVASIIFDEVDSGIGGATAASVGERLARIASDVQVLVVTHSPQVAARGNHHLRVEKTVSRSKAVTSVVPLDEAARCEEIARMLAGETITDAARAAAASLLAVAS